MEDVGRGTVDLFLGCVPDEALRHVRAARKENLLALRAVLDSAIARLETAEKEAPKRQRTRKVKVE